MITIQIDIQVHKISLLMMLRALNGRFVDFAVHFHL